jgi:hypothetical protein
MVSGVTRSEIGESLKWKFSETRNSGHQKSREIVKSHRKIVLATCELSVQAHCPRYVFAEIQLK